MILNIIAFLLFPIACFGWAIGFLTRPLITGFLYGYTYTQYLYYKEMAENLMKTKNTKETEDEDIRDI